MKIHLTRIVYLLSLILMGATASYGQLSGNYTIDPKGSGTKNYTSVASAASALASSGVNGPVVFSIADGTYTGQVSFSSSITGASSTNTITFKSASADSNKVIITNSGSYTLYYSGADYIHFERVTITSTGYSYVIYLGSGSDYNNFHGCKILAQSTSSYNVYNYGSYNKFSHCRVTGSYYAFYLYGPGTGSSCAKGNEIVNCRIVNYEYYGIIEYYQANSKINYNYIDSAASKNMGIYSWYNQNQQIIGNTIHGQAYGIYMYYENYYGSTSDTTIMANNILRDEAYYGIYSAYTPRMNVFHNVFEGGSGNYSAIFQYLGGSRVVNNIFICSGAYYGFYCYYSTSSDAPKVWDYNDYYFPSATYFGVFEYYSYASLASLKSTYKGYHQNCVEVDPEFSGKRDGRTYVPGLNNIGKNVGIKRDIDHNPRPNTTDKKVDIGCNDYYLAPYDLDVNALISPLSVKLGTNTVTASFKNAGSQTLTSISVTVDYSTDGGSSWTAENISISSLKPGASYNHTFSKTWTPTKAGSYKFGIRISKQVSGDPDAKDEKFWNICTGLAGNYTIGRKSGTNNFATFKDAIAALSCGVAGKVVFDVHPGTYSGNLTIPVLFGSNKSNTVTFHSAHVDSCKITNSASGSGDMNTILLNGADWVTFENFTIEAAGSSYGVGIMFTNSANHNQILNNKILSGTGGSSYQEVIVFSADPSNYYGYGDNGNYNLIQGNDMQGGYFSVYMSGSSESAPIRGNQLINNKITKAFYYGIYCEYNDSIDLIGNTIKDFSYTYNYGIIMYYFSNFHIESNYSSAYYYCDFELGNYTNYNNVTRSTFNNNMFVSTGGYYVMFLYYCSYTDVFHNTFVVNSSVTYGGYIYYNQYVDVRNNIFSYDGSSYILYLYSNSFSDFDYNDFYHPKGGTFYVDGISYSNLSSMAGATGYNKNSWELDPNLISATDLHVGKKFPNMFGAKVKINKDIDGDPRCVFSPSIGADEFVQSALPPSANFLAPDTVWLNSPTSFLNAAKASNVVQAKWYVDGVFASDSFHLVHAFKSAGTATISLAMENCGGKDSISKTVYISAALRKPKVDFTATMTTFYTGDVIRLKDLSENGPTYWKWTVTPVWTYDPFLSTGARTFNYVGKDDSSTTSPVLYFDYPGVFEVCLVVSNSKGADSVCKTAYLNVRQNFQMCQIPEETISPNGTLYDDGGPTGNYSAGKTGSNVCWNRVTQCAGELDLTFREFDIDKSDFLRIWDGTSASGRPMWDAAASPNGMNGQKGAPGVPTKLTAKSGSFYVEFESDANATTTSAGFAIDWTVNPTSFSAPIADFNMPDTACVGYPVYFENTSGGMYSDLEWDVNNDNNLEGFSQTLNYTFTTPGTYEVKLTAIGDCSGRDSLVQKIVIENAKKAPKPALHVSSRQVAAGDTVSINDLTEYCSASTRWEITPANYVIANGGTLSDRNMKVIFTKGGFYDLKLVKSNAFGADSITYTKYIQVLDYCTPNVLFTDEDISINRVIFNTIDNASSSSSGYTNYYNTISTTVERGLTYYLQVDRNTNKTAMSRKVWIDYNNDGDFDDAGELVASEKPSTNLSFHDSITIPSTSTAASTRMRVAVSYKNDQNAACGPHSFGEFEDYKIIISPFVKTPPVITLKGSKSDTLEVYSTWVEPGYTATSKLSGVLTSSVVVSSSLDNTVLGTYTITYSVADGAGNVASASRTIYVVDRTLPTIALNGSDSIFVEIYNGYKELGVMSADNYDVSMIVNMTSNVDTNNLGEYTVEYCVKDASENGPVCTSRKVVVGDTTKPVIVLVGAASIQVHVYESFTDEGYTVLDNNMVGLMVTSSGSWTGSPLKLGTFDLVYTATDASGNMSSVTRTIEVIDTKAPFMELLGDLSVEVERWATFSDPLYNVSDNYYNNSELTVTTGGTFVNTQSEGIYYITYQAEDPSGNKSALLTRLVKVVPSTSIGIQNPNAINLNVYPNPTNGMLNLSVQLAGTEYVKVTLLNSLGQEMETIASGLTNALNQSIDISNYSSGIYYIQVSTGKETHVERINLNK